MSRHDRLDTISEARRRLEQGNRAFAADNDSNATGEVAPQRPFAAVLGCADARVPVVQAFGQGWNDIFVMRVAGNGLNAEALGSLQYAVKNLPSLRLAAVLGHSSCGAMTAAVDAWLDPSSYVTSVPTMELRAIVQVTLISVRAASGFLEDVYGPSVVERPGYRTALIETTSAVHAAITSGLMLGQARQMTSELEVVFGVFDIASRTIGLTADHPGLYPAPTGAEAVRAFGHRVAHSAVLRDLLEP